MITITDINKHLVAPEGYTAEQVVAEGAYLRVQYRAVVLDGETLKGESYVDIFLNDYGREVLRTEKFYRHIPPPPPEPKPVVPDTFLGRLKYRWEQFCGDDSAAF